MSNPSQITDMVEMIEEKSQTRAVDVMVHSAGGVRSRFKTPIENVSDDDWRVIQAVNVDGAFNLTRAVVPNMKRVKSGRIIVISSRAGLGVSLTGVQSYGTAKPLKLGW